MVPKPKLPGVPPTKAEVTQVEEVFDDGQGAQMSLFEHLDELRERLTKAVLALVAGTLIGVLVATPVIEYLLVPNQGERMVVLGPTGSVVNYFRVSIMVGAIIAIPVMTYQILMFILPGLTRKEKRILLTSLPAVTLLFLIGVAFAWFILTPSALGFLRGFQPTLFRPEWTADEYLGFVTALLFWMGVAFETPLIFFVLSLLGIVSAGALINNWRVAVVGSAVAAALITPTVDPVNMFLVMGPLLALYTFSILLVMIGRRISKVDAS
jgi:sec-independent protein translocase protein TatC